jgi:hypothetical protein
MLHSYQVLEVIRMDRQRELARWQLIRATRSARPSRGLGWLRVFDGLARSRRALPARRPRVDAAACC